MDSLRTAQADLTQILSMARAQTSQFTRTKLPQLLPEYKQILKLVHEDPGIQDGALLQNDKSLQLIDGSMYIMPKESKLLTKLPYNDKKGESYGNFCCCSWGLQWNEEEFVYAAVDLGHPKSFLKALPTELQDVVYKLASMQDAEVVATRARWFSKWVKRAEALRHEEFSFHKKIDDAGQKVVAAKRILLFKEMLHDAGYYDAGIADVLDKGVPIIGPVQESGHFPKAFKPALISTSLLQEKSNDISSAILAGTVSSGSQECDEFVYSETIKEVCKGWLQGPIQKSELEAGFSVSRRFGLWQKTKYRCIDDFSGSLVNATCSIYESPLLHTIDMSAALLNLWMDSQNANCDRQKLLGRSFDLKAAYRQLFIAADSRKHAYIAVYNPSTGKPEIFRGIALPFGSVQSVYNFLRMSHAIWFLGTTQLMLPWTYFYDDFMCFSTSNLAEHTNKCVSLFFKLIGWKIAEEGPKAKDFDTVFDCLGVNFDLTKVQSHSEVYISNTASRISELTKEIDTVLKSGKLKRTLGNKLRGRMQFAENQVFGRLNRRCLKAISEHSVVGSERLSHQTMILMEEFKRSLNASRPRTISARLCGTWIIFTDAFYDAALEPNSGAGGVIVSPTGCIEEYFSEPVEEQLSVMMGHGTKGTIIFEAELLAVWAATKLWHKRFANSMLVVYVDNDALRGAYAASTTRTGMVGKLLELLNTIEEEFNIHVWVARVPTKCNIADSPSRFECGFLEKCKATKCDIRLNIDVLRV